MARIFFRHRDRKYSSYAKASISLAAIGAVFLLATGPFYHLGIIPNAPDSLSDIAWRYTLASIGGIATTTAIILLLLAYIHAALSARVKTGRLGFFSLIIIAFSLAPLWMTFDPLARKTDIHDVTTNLEDPPRFTTLPRRSYDASDRENITGGRFDPDYMTRHQRLYPDLTGVLLSEPKEEVMIVAARIAEELGWRIIVSDPENGHLEAAWTSLWYDEDHLIVIRVTDHTGVSRLDIRAMSAESQDGKGSNHKLIIHFLRMLKTSFNA